MTSVTFRPMTLADYDAVTTLWQQTNGVRLRDADSIAGIEKYLQRNPGLSFVAEQAGTQSTNVIGTIMGGHDGKRGYIQHLAVANQTRRQRVGARLVALCLDALKQEGILKSHIMILTDNEAGKAFWREQGWELREDIEVYSFVNGDNPNV